METTALQGDKDMDKSFSFDACSEFKYSSSSLALFSDDDDDGGDVNKYRRNQNKDDESDTDDNSYIEIALDHHPKTNDHHQTTSFDEGSGGGSGCRGLQDLDDNLRISFSSSFPASIPEVQIINDEAAVLQTLTSSFSSSSSSSSVRLSASTLRSSSTGTCRGPMVGSESFSLYESSRRRDQLPPFNPLVHSLLFNLEAAPPETAEENGGYDHRQLDHRQLAIINTDNGKASNIIATTTTNSGNNIGIMKLFTIKFRATKVRKLLASLFAKSRGQFNFSSNKLGNERYRKRSGPLKETLDQYYDHHHHHQYDQRMYCFSNDNINKINDSKKSSQNQRRTGHDKYSRALDVNLGAVRGVLEAVNVTRNGRTNRKTSSCPSSIKSSPIHQGFTGGDAGKFFAGENSIQAAIAHCKSSLGQSSDFRF